METSRPSSPGYHAYLLRIWLSNGAAGDACWRASLQDTTGGQRIGFASLEELFVFLMNDVTAPTADDGRAHEGDTTDGQRISG